MFLLLKIRPYIFLKLFGVSPENHPVKILLWAKKKMLNTDSGKLSKCTKNSSGYIWSLNFCSNYLQHKPQIPGNCPNWNLKQKKKNLLNSDSGKLSQKLLKNILLSKYFDSHFLVTLFLTYEKIVFFEKWLNIAKRTYISGKRLYIVKKRCKNRYMHFFIFFAFFL